MRDLQYYAMECINDMINIGIDVPEIQSFTVNTRAKKRFGQCKRIDGEFYININVNLLNEECPLLSLKETLYHEIIHTLPKCFNHGQWFHYYAEMVNNAYGTHVDTTNTFKEKYGEEFYAKVASTTTLNRPYREYAVYCPNCDRIVASGKYRRSPKWFAHAERFKCKRCGCGVMRDYGVEEF